MLAGMLLLSGCALFVGGAAVGAGAAGTYVYEKGELKTDYPAELNDVWSAVEKTVAEMRGQDVERNKEIAKGTINAVINGDNVIFTVLYKDKNITTVAVRVKRYLISGDELASKLLQDKIAGYLSKR